VKRRRKSYNRKDPRVAPHVHNVKNEMKTARLRKALIEEDNPGGKWIIHARGRKHRGNQYRAFTNQRDPLCVHFGNMRGRGD